VKVKTGKKLEVLTKLKNGRPPGSLFFQISEVTTDFLETFAPFLGIAIVQKMAITAVPGLEAERVFDGAPVLFRATGDLLHVSDYTVHIFAIAAIKAFHGIKVKQVPAIHDDVVTAFDLRYAIDGKADGLIDVGHNMQ
jgi:hypothetical protein